MSTRATITLKDKTTNKYKTIYLHHDGYIDRAGYVLKTYYSDYNNVNKLIDLGDLSTIGRKPESDPNLWDMQYWMNQFDKATEDAIKKLHWSERPDYAKCKTYLDRGDADVTARIHDSLNFLNDWDDIEYSYVFEDNQWYLYNPADEELIEF